MGGLRYPVAWRVAISLPHERRSTSFRRAHRSNLPNFARADITFNMAAEQRRLLGMYFPNDTTTPADSKQSSSWAPEP